MIPLSWIVLIALALYVAFSEKNDEDYTPAKSLVTLHRLRVDRVKGVWTVYVTRRARVFPGEPWSVIFEGWVTLPGTTLETPMTQARRLALTQFKQVADEVTNGRYF